MTLAEQTALSTQPAEPPAAAGVAAEVGAGGLVAVLPVRGGVLPLGAAEVVVEAGGVAVLVGSGTRGAAGELPGLRAGWYAEVGDYAPGRWAAALAGPLRDTAGVLLPASADGRDLAPRLAAALDRPLLAGSVRVDAAGADLLRWSGRVGVPAHPDGPFVATLVPGVRGTADVTSPGGTPAFEPPPGDAADAQPLPEAAAEPGLPRDAGPLRNGAGAAEPGQMEDAGPPAAHSDAGPPAGDAGLRELPLTLGTGPDCRVTAVLPADPATADLAEAPRILAAGAGLLRGAADPAGTVALLAAVAAALGASVGATRVVTDAGWIGYQRQIGTTGVLVDPELYVAFGISGAAQHVGGLGRPRHVVSVNTDPSCPMTAQAELGIVADARAVLAELARRLGVPAGAGARDPVNAAATAAPGAGEVRRGAREVRR